MTDWLFGIPYELAFWEASLKNKTTRESLLRFSHLGSDITLDGFDVQSFLLQQPDPTQAIVLDVGSGMSFLPGDHISTGGRQQAINIRYIDPLALFYNNITTKHRLGLPQVEFGMMEYLSAFYPEHNVSLVIIQNALDHSDNPVKGIIEAVGTLKTGGILYLNHHPDEAEYENYRGFHKYNIRIEDNSLIIWNKQQRINVNEILKTFARIEVQTVDGNPVAVITKTADVPAGLIDKNKDISTLSKAILDYTQSVISPRKMCRYHLQLLYYRIGQRLSKLLPWQTRQKIKQIINKLHKR